MKNRQIPKTDLEVSEISLGTMTFGTPVGESEAIKLVDYSIGSGINFIDTANMYEGYKRTIGSVGGVAEEILGKALKERRNKVILATKVGMKVGNEPEDEFTSPAAIRKQLDRSLARLKTDFIDIYYLHKYDPVTPPEEIVGAIQKAMEEGKIRYYGISNYSADQLGALLKAADESKLPRPVICQPPLSLLKQESLEAIIPLCARESIAVVPYQILQGGLLTGKYRRGEPLPKDSRKAEKNDWVWELSDELFDKLEGIRMQAEKSGLTMTQYAINWVLKQKAVVSALVGVKNAAQIDEAIKAASI